MSRITGDKLVMCLCHSYAYGSSWDRAPAPFHVQHPQLPSWLQKGPFQLPVWWAFLTCSLDSDRTHVLDTRRKLPFPDGLKQVEGGQHWVTSSRLFLCLACFLSEYAGEVIKPAYMWYWISLTTSWNNITASLKTFSGLTCVETILKYIAW